MYARELPFVVKNEKSKTVDICFGFGRLPIGWDALLFVQLLVCEARVGRAHSFAWGTGTVPLAGKLFLCFLHTRSKLVA